MLNPRRTAGFRRRSESFCVFFFALGRVSKGITASLWSSPVIFINRLGLLLLLESAFWSRFLCRLRRSCQHELREYRRRVRSHARPRKPPGIPSNEPTQATSRGTRALAFLALLIKNHTKKRLGAGRHVDSSVVSPFKSHFDKKQSRYAGLS